MAIAELKPAQTASLKIDAKRAAQQALKYFNDLFPNERHSNMSLEEVEFSEDENYWLITLGYESKLKRSVNAASTNMATALLGPTTTTKYKIFKVDARTGKVLSMKIRKFE